MSAKVQINGNGVVIQPMESNIGAYDAKIPRSEISTREAGNGRTLDYVSGYYVIKRLNAILGQGNWGYEIQNTALVYQGEIQPPNRGKVFTAHYLTTVRLTACVGSNTVVFSDVGYGDGTDKQSPGKAHELAAKEAVTDALKRCAKNLGMSFGLALYDKAQEFVDEEEPQSTQPSKAEAVKDKAPEPITATQEETFPGFETVKAAANGVRKPLKSAMQVLISQGKISTAELKKKYVFEKLDDLSDEAILVVYGKVKNDYPELQLN